MMLAIEVGNSFIKWKLWDAQGKVISADRAKATKSLAEIFSFTAAQQVSKVVLSNVAKQTIEDELVELFARAEFITISSASHYLDLVNAYVQPEKLGVDRWIGMIEAYYLSDRSAVCVIDLGTAATLDVVDASGQHMGGYIVPGLGLMRSTLLQSTARVQAEVEGDYASAYGLNTTQAVDNGLQQMVVSWLNHEVSRFFHNYPQGQVYMTGGDAERVAAHLNDKRITVCKELLLDGMRRVALQ